MRNVFYILLVLAMEFLLSSCRLSGGITNADESTSSVTLPPSLISLTPESGSTLGGTLVTLTGKGFLPEVSVTIGDKPCTELIRESETSLSCSTPPHAAGKASVVLTNTDGESASLLQAFTFVDSEDEEDASSLGTIQVSQNSTTLVSGSSFSFGVIKVNFTTEPLDFILQNTGTGPLTISSIAISGTSASEFQIISAPSGAIAAGGSETLQVKMLPTSSGAKSASLNITTDDANTPVFSIPLVGHTEWGTHFIDGNHAVTGLNYNTSKPTETPEMIVFNNKLYIFWDEVNGGD